MKAEEIRRRRDGSIDTAYYTAQARLARAHQARDLAVSVVRRAPDAPHPRPATHPLPA